jgi:hypothetical protein
LLETVKGTVEDKPVTKHMLFDVLQNTLLVAALLAAPGARVNVEFGTNA